MTSRTRRHHRGLTGTTRLLGHTTSSSVTASRCSGMRPISSSPASSSPKLRRSVTEMLLTMALSDGSRRRSAPSLLTRSATRRRCGSAWPHARRHCANRTSPTASSPRCAPTRASSSCWESTAPREMSPASVWAPTSWVRGESCRCCRCSGRCRVSSPWTCRTTAFGIVRCRVSAQLSPGTRPSGTSTCPATPSPGRVGKRCFSWLPATGG
mmetsp:Transcript_13880/g.43209  ORF Transcript_13880/g.43209 Transcript_13880/m.43209 type:complete len:211 (-) Transcript_13880:113-745(-)